METTEQVTRYFSGFSSGRPRFPAPLQDLARREGDEAAWRALLSSASSVAERMAAIAKVDGDFAFFVTLESGLQIGACDRMAIQPLCYRVDGGQLRCDPRADRLADAGQAISAQSIYDYLFFHMIPAPRTIFEGIARLPAGHCVEVQDGKTQVSAYWTPTFAPRASADFKTEADEFRSILSAAVKEDMGDAAPACFLSGGTDSSSVAGMLSRHFGGDATAYSIGFEAEGYDEMEYARLTAKHFGIRHREYYVTPDDLLQSMPTVAAFHDQPFGNSSAVPAYYCARMAASDGVTRLLAGDGGDELFGGNTRYAKQRVFGWWQNVPGFLRRPLEPVIDSAPMRAVPLLRKAASYVEQAASPMPDRLLKYNLLLHVGAANIFSPALLSQIDTGLGLQLQRQVWSATKAEGDLDRNLGFDWRFTLADNDLPKVREAAGMAGVGVAFPFLDRAMIDFSARLPSDYKLRGFQLRWFFKEALRGFLHDDTITKKKQGFGLPFGTWLNRNAAMQKMAREALDSLAARGVILPGLPAQLMTELLPSHPHYFGELVWLLSMLEFWLQAHAPHHKL
ncbi:asparagine synthetase B family protein [Burkholderiaceae bacterium UC74_6]